MSLLERSEELLKSGGSLVIGLGIKRARNNVIFRLSFPY